jgi:hypothetical protein
VLLVLVGLALGLMLSGGSTQSEVEIRQQRAEIALLAKELLPLEGPLQRVTSIWKRTWPLIDEGLRSPLSGAVLREISSAAAAAQVLETPSFVALQKELFGPPRRIAGLYSSFLTLSRQGWSHVVAAADEMSGRPSAASRFAEENAGLYVESIYQASFDLGLLGERVLHTYEHLGGEPEFGSALTEREVASIAGTFSPGVVELLPNDWRQLEERAQARSHR